MSVTSKTDRIIIMFYAVENLSIEARPELGALAYCYGIVRQEIVYLHSVHCEHLVSVDSWRCRQAGANTPHADMASSPPFPRSRHAPSAAITAAAVTSRERAQAPRTRRRTHATRIREAAAAPAVAATAAAAISPPKTDRGFQAEDGSRDPRGASAERISRPGPPPSQRLQRSPRLKR